VATSKDGLTAEVHFLQACENLGFRKVQKTNPFTSCTIRKTEGGGYEDVIKMIDFVITLPRDGKGRSLPIVPIQLTLTCHNTSTLSRKKRLSRNGKFALIMPTHEFGFKNQGKTQQVFIKMLEDAACGRTVALWAFSVMLRRKCEEFLGQDVVERRGLREFPTPPSFQNAILDIDKSDVDVVVPWLTKQERKNITSIRQNRAIGNKHERFIKVRKYLLNLAY